MRIAAQKAVALDESNAEAHVYLAEGERVLDWNVVGADAELHRALQLDPNSASAHLFSSLNCFTEGKPKEGAAHMREAVRADPLSPIISNFSAVSFLILNQFDEAIAEGKRTLELDPNYLYEFPVLGEAYREKGMFPEAIAIFERAQQVTGLPQPGLAITYARTGRQAEARQILDDLKKFADTRYLPAEEVAGVCAALGDNDQAFQWLDRAYAEHSGPLHAIAVRPVFRPLYSDPRFADILRRIGVDPTRVLGAKTP
jgi:tetratricopeptide (TPR) repeat protein